MGESYSILVAKLLVNHSCALVKGQRVLIEAVNAPLHLVLALIRAAREKDAVPFVLLKHDQVIRELIRSQNVEDIALTASAELMLLNEMDAYIGVRGFDNCFELRGLPESRMHAVRDNYIKPVHLDCRNSKNARVFFRWPTSAMAQRAGQPTEDFVESYFRATLIQYQNMADAARPLQKMMSQSDQVHIVGPGATNLKLSIREMPVNIEAGAHNLPDGEVLTAPIISSVEGDIEYNVSSIYEGTRFDNVFFHIEAGRVVRHSSSNKAHLLSILSTDKGAQHFGEFAIGINPFIDSPIGDGLYDEKMWGTVHLALGNAYAHADNGNRSAIHWDLILSQKLEDGGGKLFFDSVMVRENGKYVLPELMGLNPENMAPRVAIM